MNEEEKNTQEQQTQDTQPTAMRAKTAAEQAEKENQEAKDAEQRKEETQKETTLKAKTAEEQATAENEKKATSDEDTNTSGSADKQGEAKELSADEQLALRAGITLAQIEMARAAGLQDADIEQAGIQIEEAVKERLETTPALETNEGITVVNELKDELVKYEESQVTAKQQDIEALQAQIQSGDLTREQVEANIAKIGGLQQEMLASAAFVNEAATTVDAQIDTFKTEAAELTAGAIVLEDKMENVQKEIKDDLKDLGQAVQNGELRTDSEEFAKAETALLEKENVLKTLQEQQTQITTDLQKYADVEGINVEADSARDFEKQLKALEGDRSDRKDLLAEVETRINNGENIAEANDGGTTSSDGTETAINTNENPFGTVEYQINPDWINNIEQNTAATSASEDVSTYDSIPEGERTEIIASDNYGNAKIEFSEDAIAAMSAAEKDLVERTTGKDGITIIGAGALASIGEDRGLLENDPLETLKAYAVANIEDDLASQGIALEGNTVSEKYADAVEKGFGDFANNTVEFGEGGVDKQAQIEMGRLKATALAAASDGVISVTEEQKMDVIADRLQDLGAGTDQGLRMQLASLGAQLNKMGVDVDLTTAGGIVEVSAPNPNAVNEEYVAQKEQESLQV